MRPDIVKVGLLLIEDGRVLLCARRKTPLPLTLPGGKMEPGETELECLARELHEELGRVSPTNLLKLGDYSHFTAELPPRTIRIILYSGSLTGRPSPHSEISELVWFPPDGNPDHLPPSLRDLIFPDLIQRRILPWPPPR